MSHDLGPDFSIIDGGALGQSQFWKESRLSIEHCNPIFMVGYKTDTNIFLMMMMMNDFIDLKTNSVQSYNKSLIYNLTSMATSITILKHVYKEKMNIKFTGLNIKFFSREPNCIFQSYLTVLCIETCTSLGSLKKFEHAAGEFKGAPGTPGTP